MNDYTVFGSRLRSEIPLASLHPADAGEPRWTLRIVKQPLVVSSADLLGEDEVDAGVRVRLFRHAHGYRLVYDDTGSFDVLEGGSRIEWTPRPGADPTAAGLDVLGRVLPTAMHAAGTLCLHGSAVALGETGVAFLAPKFHGKSTLAQALVRAGAGLITDDVVPVDPGPPAAMRPGVQHLRLWDDSAARLTPLAGRAAAAGAKHVVDAADDARPLRPLPVSAVYLLAPVRGEPGRPAVRRTPLPPLAAAMSVLRHSRLGMLLGKGDAAALLDRAVRLAAAAPVYTLELVRDFDRLGDVVDQLVEWHPGTLAAAAT